MSKDPDGPRPRPYVRAFAGSEEDFPTYVLKVLGRDRSWMDNGACRDHELARKRAWTVRSGEKVKVGDFTFAGRSLIEAALKVCGGCPAQYQCATWAIEVREESGTWAMTHDDLLWLGRQDDAEGIINMARVAEVAVHVAVRDAKNERRRAERHRGVSSST